MHVVGKMKKSLLNQHAKETEALAVPLQFYRARLPGKALSK
jgi:23S rRNA 5-hydroxycytidine C2501 synthase